MTSDGNVLGVDGVASHQNAPHQTSAASDGSVMTYAVDPFKLMAREYDRRVIRKGGGSIFSLRDPTRRLSEYERRIYYGEQ